jgi:hypothetical protein
MAMASYVIERRGPGPFQEYLDTSPGPRWEVWKRDFELIMEANKIKGSDRKVWLLAQGGPDIQRLNAFLPPYNDEGDKETGSEASKDEYEKLILRLDAYFKPKVLFVLERAKFRELVQNQNERVDSFIVRLREQGAKCNFGDCLDIMIIDQVIAKCRSEKLRERLKEKDFSLTKVQTIAASFELQETDSISSVNRVEMREKGRVSDTRTCFSCGRIGHISTSDKCPAKGKRCRKCNGFGHFENRCRKRKMENPDEKRSETKKFKFEKGSHVNTVTEEEEPRSIYDIFASTSGREDLNCEIGGLPRGVLVDSGADLNIMGQSHWEELKGQKFKIWDVVAGNGGKVLRGYASSTPMEIMGSFKTTVKSGSNMIVAQFWVVKGGNCIILGRKSSEELEVLKIGHAVNLVNESFSKIKGM